MSDKSMNIIRAIGCALISVCCFSLKIFGIAKENAAFPYIGGALCAFLAIAYLKQAFSE